MVKILLLIITLVALLSGVARADYNPSPFSILYLPNTWAQTQTFQDIIINGTCTGAGCGSGGSGGGGFTSIYLVDSLGGKWSITEDLTGHLVTSSVSSIPSGAYAPNQLVFRDNSASKFMIRDSSSNLWKIIVDSTGHLTTLPGLTNLWKVTIDTTGHLVTTAMGSMPQAIDGVLVNDANKITWINTVDDLGHMVTQ